MSNRYNPQFRTFVDESDPDKMRETPTIYPLRYEMGERRTPVHPEDVAVANKKEHQRKLGKERIKQILDTLKGKV